MSDRSNPQRMSRSELLLAEARGDVTALRGAVDSLDTSHRILVLGALHRLVALEDELLIKSLSDSEPTVRIRALELAVPRRSIDLLASLADADDLVVESAAWALGERGDASDRVVDALCAVALDHEVSICREAAIAALGALEAERGLEAILAGMSDRAPVRRRAVLALAPFDEPRVHAALTTALDDRDRQVRQAAEDLI